MKLIEVLFFFIDITLHSRALIIRLCVCVCCSSTDFHVLTVGNDHTAYVYSQLPTEDHLSSDEYD